MTFDVFSPPGLLTTRGSSVSIDDSGVLYLGHGSRAVLINYSPLQWHLLGTALARFLSDPPAGMEIDVRPKGAVSIDTERATLKISKTSLGLELTANSRSGSVRIALTKSEAGELLGASRNRAHQATQGEV